MLFARCDFLLFFALVFAGYWVLGRVWLLRAVWVIAASYFFYMAGSKPVDGPLPTPWYFAGLLLLSTLTSYLVGLGIGAARRRAIARGEAPGGDDSRLRRGKAWLWLGLVINLGLLAY